MRDSTAGGLLLLMFAVIASGCASSANSRGEIVGFCSVKDMPGKPAYAEYYDKDDKILIHTYKGVQTAVVEDMFMTQDDRYCEK